MNDNISQNAGRQIKNARYLPTCHSTNSFANDWLKEHEVEDGWAVYTFDQTHGRGQGTNVWESEPFKNLTFSVIYHPDYLLPQKQFILNMVVSLGIVQFLDRMGLKAEVKWPNDIYVNGKKIAGILIENHLRGNAFRHSIVGIGLNVNQTSFEVAKATSIFIEHQQEYNLLECLDFLLFHLYAQMQRLRENELETISADYHHYMYQRNKPALYKTGETAFTGSIKGVDEQGRLRMLTQDGEKVFELKEIQFLS